MKGRPDYLSVRSSVKQGLPRALVGRPLGETVCRGLCWLPTFLFWCLFNLHSSCLSLSL